MEMLLQLVRPTDCTVDNTVNTEVVSCSVSADIPHYVKESAQMYHSSRDFIFMSNVKFTVKIHTMVFVLLMS